MSLDSLMYRKDLFDTVLQDVHKLLPDYDKFISGGAVYDLLDGKEDIKDIDVFIGADAYPSEATRHITHSTYVDIVKPFNPMSKEYNDAGMAVVTVDLDVGYDVQLVFISQDEGKSLQEVVFNSFDFNICRALYDMDGSVIQDSLRLKDLTDKTITFNMNMKDRSPASLLKRAEKIQSKYPEFIMDSYMTTLSTKYKENNNNSKEATIQRYIRAAGIEGYQGFTWTDSSTSLLRVNNNSVYTG